MQNNQSMISNSFHPYAAILPCVAQYSDSSETPLLKWGTESGVLTTTVAATTTRIQRHQMCGRPANSTGWRDGGLLHTALLSGMVALGGKSFVYIFGDGSTNEFSKEMIFFVPAPRGIVVPSRFCHFTHLIFVKLN